LKKFKATLSIIETRNNQHPHNRIKNPAN
jgi:hypothetical protein